MQDNKKPSEFTVEELVELQKTNPDFFLGEVLAETLRKVMAQEVEEKSGKKYERGKEYHRWGSNQGSFTTQGVKSPIEVPRLRHKVRKECIEPEAYKRIRKDITIPAKMVNAIINGISQRKYGLVGKILADSFGISQSVISRKFVINAKAAMKEFMERDLGNYDIVAIMIDGKYFAKEQVVHAVGITSAGDKIMLGFVHTTTENEESITGLFTDLINRNLRFENGLLIVCDGSRGIRKAVDSVFGEKALVQRCQWHKRENVVSYLSDERQEEFRDKLRFAYSQENYDEAKRRLTDIASELERINTSAYRSLLEGMEETLTIHKLGLKKHLGKSLCTTNIIENVNSQLEKRLRNVKRWRTGKMRSYWIAVTLLDIERNMRRINNADKMILLKRKLNERTKTVSKKVS